MLVVLQEGNYNIGQKHRCNVREITIMAKQLKRMDVSELDFDQIKSNLKTFLRGQTEFTDYDFEGSGMNILLDTLALSLIHI